MNWKLLTKDIIAAVLWVVIRSLPFVAIYVGECWTKSDAPWFMTLSIYLFILVWVSYIAAMVTNAVPAITWRYRSKHITRLIELDGEQYRQIRLFGIWFFITLHGEGEWCKLKAWRAQDEEELRVYNRNGDENEKFIKAFDIFVNAWRYTETVEVLKHQVFEGGRPK